MIFDFWSHYVNYYDFNQISDPSITLAVIRSAAKAQIYSFIQGLIFHNANLITPFQLLSNFENCDNFSLIDPNSFSFASFLAA